MEIENLGEKSSLFLTSCIGRKLKRWVSSLYQRLFYLGS